MDENETQDLQDELQGALNLERTNELFDASIKRSGAKGTTEYNEEDIKKQRIVIGYGNLHLNTAKTKISASRMTGYRDGLDGAKRSVDRKVRNNLKFGA